MPSILDHLTRVFMNTALVCVNTNLNKSSYYFTILHIDPASLLTLPNPPPPPKISVFVTLNYILLSCILILLALGKTSNTNLPGTLQVVVLNYLRLSVMTK